MLTLFAWAASTRSGSASIEQAKLFSHAAEPELACALLVKPGFLLSDKKIFFRLLKVILFNQVFLFIWLLILFRDRLVFLFPQKSFRH